MSLPPAIGNPLTLLHEKDAEGESTGVWSNKRTVALMFAIGYLANWPDETGTPDVALAAAIIFALAIYRLSERVPGGEVLGALGAFMNAKMFASVEKVRSAAISMAQRVGGPSPGYVQPKVREGDERDEP